MTVSGTLDPARQQSLIEESRGDFERISARLRDHPDAMAVLERFVDTWPDSLYAWIALAELADRSQDFEKALTGISQADLLAVTPVEQERVSAVLRDIVSHYERKLLQTGNFDALDNLYERLTLTMPEQAWFFLKLGQLRIRMGRYEQALIPLAQIENHMQFGRSARELIEQTAVDESTGVLEVVPIERYGSQFLIRAVVDGAYPVRLLVDTGAAMTILDRRVLGNMGYDPGQSPRGLFSTANGVVEAPVVSVGELALGETRVGPISVGALPLGLPEGIDGLLGMNFLRRYEFRIDQDKGELHLSSER